MSGDLRGKNVFPAQACGFMLVIGLTQSFREDEMIRCAQLHRSAIFAVTAGIGLPGTALSDATVQFVPDLCRIDAEIQDVLVIGQVKLGGNSLQTFSGDETGALGQGGVDLGQYGYSVGGLGVSNMITNECIYLGASSSGGVDDPFGNPSDGSNVLFKGDIFVPSGREADDSPILVVRSSSLRTDSVLDVLPHGSSSHWVRLVFHICGLDGYKRFELIESGSGDVYSGLPVPFVDGSDPGVVCEGEYLTNGTYVVWIGDPYDSSIGITDEHESDWELRIYDESPPDLSGCDPHVECNLENVIAEFVLDQCKIVTEINDQLSPYLSAHGSVPALASGIGYLAPIGDHPFLGGDEPVLQSAPDLVRFEGSNVGLKTGISADDSTQAKLRASISQSEDAAGAEIIHEIEIRSSATKRLQNVSGQANERFDADLVFEVSGVLGAVPLEFIRPATQSNVTYSLFEYNGPPVQTGPGALIANGVYSVHVRGVLNQFPPIFDTTQDLEPLIIRFRTPDLSQFPLRVEEEPNDTQEERNIITLPEGEDVLHFTGKLMPEEFPGCQPDTFLALFDKDGVRVAFNDNDDCAGNGWGSGISGATIANGMIINNNDGTYSVRAGVTGRPDGIDGNFNGLFFNGPHGQLGGWEMVVTFHTAAGIPDEVLVNDVLQANPVRSSDEFLTGAEAFRLNYVFGPEITSVDLCVDNTAGMVEVCNDVDYFEIEGLVPLCEYCIEQVGGLTDACEPTDTLIGWFDKLGTVILKSDDGGAVDVWPRLCVVADINGKAIIAVTGTGDCDFDGFADDQPRAAPLCPEPPVGHGVCGCYTFRVEVEPAHSGGGNPGDQGGGVSGDEAMQRALIHGDLNMDGVTDSADLGILVGQFGWGME